MYEFEKNDVWMYNRSKVVPLRILKVTETSVKHRFGWETKEHFSHYVIEYLGKARVFLGIWWGINTKQRKDM